MKKMCSRCKSEYDNSFFYRNKTTKDGLQSQCKKCHNLTSNNWAKRNPHLLSCAIKKYYVNNRKSRVASVRRYVEKNREKSRFWKAASDAKRRAAKIKAHPEWADNSKIREFYIRASVLTKETGVIYHVDHIVPLLGKDVCGLHVQDNLQVITAKENVAKSNNH
jgi:hypothetical protein